MEPNIQIFRDPEALARAAAKNILRVCTDAVRKKGRADLALSGGSSPLAVYELLAREPFSSQMPWPHMHVFWGDERAVPRDHAQSNYGAWLHHGGDQWPLEMDRIHPMPGDLGAHAGAESYESLLRAHFGPKGRPQFDLVLLGLGPDGHFASLFPHAPALREQERWVAAIEAPSHIEPHLPRISLTPPALNPAAMVLFLVAGAAKAQTLARILGPEAKPGFELPASILAPNGNLVWYLDQAAAGLL